MKKKALSLCLAVLMGMSLSACGGSSGAPAAQPEAQVTEQKAETAPEETKEEPAVAKEVAAPAQTETSGEKILHAAASFAYPSLDVHKEYYGWYTSIYGISEALFKMDENMNAAPCLARSAEADGKTWTITLNDSVAFSNGSPLTAEMVVKNLTRLAEVNERFAYLGDFTITASDDQTLT
ncbi:MAG: ABC transporter substrate-binding protein, partial [Lachnospiraceae bacterium]|nr:ABC transporter substrate-binding protein [Lachnospiraceae bacterium]